MKFSSPRQLKDWINNYSNKNNVISNTILQNYMMERLLERISLSPYHDNFILKGGFLITSLVGSDLRSTLDIDTTIKAYNIETILSEKIESILARNIASTRARDYYDVYILSTLRNKDYKQLDVQDAIRKKVRERGTEAYLLNWKKYLNDIEESTDLRHIWNSYCKKYPYANGINFNLVIDSIRRLLE